MTPQQKALQDCITALEEACGNRCNAEYNPCYAREAITQAKQALDQFGDAGKMVQAQGEADPNAPWLSKAHMLCTDHGVPQGNIEWRLEVLRELFAAPQASEPAAAAAAVAAIAKLQSEPVAWVSVKDRLPPTVRGVSYRQLTTGVVLVRHSDRPDYPITAHAVLGEGLGVGIAIPTEGASDHPEIAWYSATSIDKNNPFDKKDQNYERFLPKIFGSKITHWMPIPAAPESK